MYANKISSTWQAVAYPWERHSDYVRGLPVAEEETVQIGRGSAVWLSAIACGRDLIVLRSQVMPRLVNRVVLDPDWIVIGLPLQWSGVFVFNGRTASPFDLFLSTGRDGFVTAGEGRHALVIGMRRSKLLSTCGALAGIGPDRIKLRDLAISLGPERGAPLHAALLAALAESFERPIAPGRFALRAIWESDLLSHVARLLLPYLKGDIPSDRLISNALHVVRTAERACRDLAQPPSIADLCAAAGVGEAWLHRCFVEVYDTPPARFLLQRRLSAARNRLLDPDTPARSVKDAALSLGFMEAGRFAQYYKGLYGETPSQTLLRSQQR